MSEAKTFDEVIAKPPVVPPPVTVKQSAVHWLGVAIGTSGVIASAADQVAPILGAKGQVAVGVLGLVVAFLTNLRKLLARPNAK